MRRRLPIPVLFAFTWAITTNIPFLAAADYRPATRGQPEKKFVVKPGGLLIFDADLGHGEVETGDYESVRVAFKSYYKVETAEEVEVLYDKISIEMSQTDNTVKVTVKYADDGNQATRDKIRLDFKVAIPRKFNLDIRSGGNVQVGDVDGTVKVSAGGGLTLKNVTGSVSASSKGGSLTIGNVGGTLEAHSDHSATIGNIGGRIVATTERGSLEIKEAADGIDAATVHGTVTAYLSKSPRSDCKITTNHGGIFLRLAESVAVTIDAACTTATGTIDSKFKIAAKTGGTNTRELKGDLNGGGPLLFLRASKGSIHLNK